MKRKNILFFIILSLLINITACSRTKSDNQQQNMTAGSNASEKTGPVHGGILRLFSTKPDTLNPLTTRNYYVTNFLGLVFESLVKLDRYQQPEPCLAQSWDISSDGKSWTFHLRNDVLWHDNEQLTAKDVIFTMQTIQRPDVDTVYKNKLENIESFTAVDDYTIKVNLKSTYAFMAENMTFPIIPDHIYNNAGALLPQDSNLTGTGPYKFVQYDENLMLKLASNDSWWNSGSKNPDEPGLPYIPEVQIKIYEKAENEINAFQSKEIDAAVIKNGQTAMYSIRTDLSVRKYAGNDFEFLAFNLTKPTTGEKLVRQAIAYAIDRQDLINTVLPGDAIASDLPVIPDTWLNSSNVVSYTRNLQKARELLMQNGWNEYEGVMYKNIYGADRPLTVEILVNEDNAFRCKAADKIAEDLQKVGIKASVKKVDWYDELLMLDRKEFDIALLGSRITSIPDISFMYNSAYTLSGIYGEEPAARNIAMYNNPAVDNYIREYTTEKDVKKRKEVFMNLKNVLLDDLPYIGLYFKYEGILYNKSIKGELSPNTWNPFNDITKWYLEKSDDQINYDKGEN